MAERNRDTEFGILGALVLALLLGLLCKFCVICPCSNCGEGMSYDDQSKLCCDSEKQLCCPSGSRPCDQLQGCSELQLGCQSGCCTDKCECLSPPNEKNITWTACRAGYSDCNSDGTWDCSTFNLSKACFAGKCETASDSIPPLLGTCAEGWSDCDNNASTGTSFGGGTGCECNTGSGFTCCGGKCVSTPVCKNPVAGCNSTNRCCPGWGCMVPSGNNVGECKPCSEFSGTGCGSCPIGCGFNFTSSKCTSCVNPVTCGIDKCCCGYECNETTQKCQQLCENPAACGPGTPCCSGYGCIGGACKPCNDLVGRNCTDCPQGCAINLTAGKCISCSNPSKCNASNPCCCKYSCDEASGTCMPEQICVNPDKTDYGKCDASHSCCPGYGCIGEACKPCGEFTCTNTEVCDCPIGCDCAGAEKRCGACSNPLSCVSDANCCCNYECHISGTCQLKGICLNDNECKTCKSGSCGGSGMRLCSSDDECSGIACSNGMCGGCTGGMVWNGVCCAMPMTNECPTPQNQCSDDDQCKLCIDYKCGGTGPRTCAADADCSTSTCSGGRCDGGGGWDARADCVTDVGVEGQECSATACCLPDFICYISDPSSAVGICCKNGWACYSGQS